MRWDVIKGTYPQFPQALLLLLLSVYIYKWLDNLRQEVTTMDSTQEHQNKARKSASDQERHSHAPQTAGGPARGNPNL
jgi:hypothetical protein